MSTLPVGSYGIRLAVGLRGNRDGMEARPGSHVYAHEWRLWGGRLPFRPGCISRSGVRRNKHTPDKDGRCVFCDRRK